MKSITAILEQNEDAYFAWIPEITGCVAGGEDEQQVKINLEGILHIFMNENEHLSKKYQPGYRIRFESESQS